MLPTICALKAVTAEKVGTISAIKLIERLKTWYALRELIFADFTDPDLKKWKIGLWKYSKWSDPLKSVILQFSIFFAEKKNYLKFLIPKYLYFLP